MPIIRKDAGTCGYFLGGIHTIFLQRQHILMNHMYILKFNYNYNRMRPLCYIPKRQFVKETVCTQGGGYGR